MRRISITDGIKHASNEGHSKMTTRNESEHAQEPSRVYLSTHQLLSNRHTLLCVAGRLP